MMETLAIPTSIELLAQVGSFGVLVGFIWHVLKVQIPRADERADAREARAQSAMQRLHEDCAEERRIDREQFTSGLADARESHERSLNRLADSIDKLEARGVRTRETNGGGHKG